MRKHLSIIMGIVMFIITTTLIGFVLFYCNPSAGPLALICAISGLGYTTSYLYLTNHLN